MAEQNFAELSESEDFTGMVGATDVGRRRGARFIESVTGLINLLSNKHLSRARFQVAMEEAAATTDFPILLGTMLDQTLIAGYTAMPNDYRQYIKIGTQADFRKTQLVGIYGLEKPLPAVAQFGEYKYDTLAEGGIYNTLSKFGKAFGLSFEDIVNDRLGAFTDIGTRLSRAAYKTEYRYATKLYAGGNAINPLLWSPLNGTVPQSIDQAPVSNTISLPFNATNLQAAIAKLRRQTDKFGEPLFFERMHLVVPPALEFLSWQVLNPAGLIVSGGDSTAGAKAQTQTSANVLKNYNITPHTNPYLPIIDTATGNNSWYLFIDTADAPALQMNFLRGHETPKVFMKSSNITSVGGGDAGAMNGSFENDRMDWKVRHFFGGTTIDQRAGIASIVAN